MILLPIALLLITTGNATSESIVNTTVEGENAKVETRIYTNVNGVESTITSDKPEKIQVVNDGKTVTVTTPSATPKIELAPQNDLNNDSSMFNRIFQSFRQWFANFMKARKY